MSGIYTNLAKKRAAQSKEPVSNGSPVQSPKASDPFAGKPLPAGTALDQQLFANPAPRPEKSGKHGKQDTASPVAQGKPAKRAVKPRHGFDIYEDQYEQLVIWSNEEKLQGGTGSMSRMAREALDMYIASRKKH
jgi:hypothetical protein